ncbi:hypothetical protein BG011_001361 [Mortierella polycephala]|uniref:Ornithine decarboxylase antizyme n=1 Tax=Mortierella polycephala TaxID=41804 RepID=A0A9P6U5Y3_9FUNG|nr:hypothetical protein BG011_001361 [Mortierella polycephala]
MEGLDNCNTTDSSVGGIMALGLPLDSFSSAAVSQSMRSDVLAICFSDDTSKGAQCYWRAEASGVPDIPINDCATMLTGLSGSGAREQSRQVGISEENASFVREMKFYSSSIDDDTAHPHGADEDTRKKVDATLTITSNDSKMNTWFGFKSEGALFLRGNGWDAMDIRDSVVAALDLAEEQLECELVYLCLEKSNVYLVEELVRALMYAGFEVVHPGVLPHADPKYLVLGMEL